jgi:hypothetical protein
MWLSFLVNIITCPLFCVILYHNFEIFQYAFKEYVTLCIIYLKHSNYIHICDAYGEKYIGT